MIITAESIGKIKEAYNSNKKELIKLKNHISEYGCTDNGLTDIAESFEQGYNNAMEYVFNMLDIKTNLIVEELKLNTDYKFECKLTKEYKDNKYDEWGCAFVWLGNMGAEYNFCIDNSTNKMINQCAIYKTEIDSDNYIETDYTTFVHYEIDFDNENWKEELENAMCKALIWFFNL